MKSRLQRLVRSRLITARGRIALARQIPVVTCRDCTSWDAAHASIVIVKMLLSMVIGIQIVGRRGRAILHHRHVVGRVGALELGRRSGPHGLMLVLALRRGSLGRNGRCDRGWLAAILGNILEVNGVTH